MKFSIILIAIFISAIHRSTEAVCDRNVTTEEYLEYQLPYIRPLFKHIARRSNYHFVLIHMSMRLALAAVAEGSEEPVKEQLFQALKLPQDPCFRRKIYDITIENEPTADSVELVSKRMLVLDEPHNLNSTWADNVRDMINAKVAPLSTIPPGTELLRNILSPKPIVNSVIISKLESIGNNGIWRETFANATIERNAPFYDHAGNKIGTVNLMRMKRRINLVNIPELNMKMGELPVGKNGRYRFFFQAFTGKTTIKDIVDNLPNQGTEFTKQLLANLKKTVKPIEIAIPNFTIKTDEIFVKEQLEEIGVTSIWQDAKASKYVSKPAPLPGAFIEQVRLSVGREDLEPYKPTGTEDSDSFILNKPFIITLMEGASSSMIFSGIYSRTN